MFNAIEINPRIRKRHPELSDQDIASAWKNALTIIERTGTELPDGLLVAVGVDANGRLLEMVGAIRNDGVIHIFHAMTPPSKKVLKEVGL